MMKERAIEVLWEIATMLADIAEDISKGEVEIDELIITLIAASEEMQDELAVIDEPKGQ